MRCQARKLPIHLVPTGAFGHDMGMELPYWGRVANLAYKLGLGLFVGLWFAGKVFDIDPDGGSPGYVAWIVSGAVGLFSLVIWLASEFLTGRRERGI